jgi:hypothetical protein
MRGISLAQQPVRSALMGVSRISTSSYGLLVAAAVGLGVVVLGIFLCSRNIADGDLWAKLALGAEVWKLGTLPHQDRFAFTPVLPEYVDHEWGAGAVFFGLLKVFGPTSLMWLKILLALGAVGGGLLVGRRGGCSWDGSLLLAVPASACIALGYIPVIRSHTLTYCFFALTLLVLEEVLKSNTDSRVHNVSNTRRAIWLAGGLVGITLVWVNVHGGFVAGLGIIGIYAVFATFQEFLTRTHAGVVISASDFSKVERAVVSLPSPIAVSSEGPEHPPTARSERRALPTWLVLWLALLGCVVVTCINPYGIRFWSYVLPAVLAKRPLIAEWQPLPVLAWDAFVPFRCLFILVLLALILGWERVTSKSWTGLIMLLLTAFLAWRSRRHAPFFGVAALAFAGPYLTAAFERVSRWLSLRCDKGQGTDVARSASPLAVLLTYSCLAVYAFSHWLPQASLQTLAPVGHDPVREADILSLAGVTGNLATPFHWGSYSAWRLHPKIKISMDGRYEAAYPESTFRLNASFFDKSGPEWDRLIRQFPVDYIILDLSQPGLRPADLASKGYSVIWLTEGCSALLALNASAKELRQVAASLPPTTINPLDAKIPSSW